MQPERTQKVADIANKFIQHARYKLAPGEQKLILYLATLLKPEDSDFQTYLVPVSELEFIFKTDTTQKHGSLYERLDELLRNITDKKITFPTDFTVDGMRLSGYINWVAGAVPKYDETGMPCIEFGLSPHMKPFMLGLKEKSTRFEFIEVARMKSNFSIRIYQMCKSYFYENIRHGRNVLTVGVRELKQRLGVSDKYSDYRNFRRKVLDVARAEINAKTRLSVEYAFTKKGRNITGIQIVINEKSDFTEEVEEAKLNSGRKKSKDTPAPAPANNDIQKRIALLTEAQRRAFNILTESKVSMTFALDHVLPIIKGSELEGYEDFFVLFMLAFFGEKTTAKGPREKVKAFTGWVKNRRFEEPTLYARLMEQVIDRKKHLKDAERTNRERAKKITAAEFRHLLAEEKLRSKSPEPAFSPQKKTATQASRITKAGEDTLFNQKTEPEKNIKLTFDFLRFKKEYATVYKQIRKERQTAFEHLKTAPNYKQLLENSVQAYCEKCFNEQQ